MVMIFVLHPDVNVNASLLDDTRLGKQRLEARQIIKILEAPIHQKMSWRNHPITRSWIGYVDYLKHYYNAILLEWLRRGKNNTLSFYEVPEIIIEPHWWDIKEIRYTHQANLYLKMPHHYAKILSELEDSFINSKTFYNGISSFDYFIRIGYIFPSNVSEIDLLALRDGYLLPGILAEKISERLISPRYCPAIIKSGSRKGQYCANILDINKKVCGHHKSLESDLILTINFLI